MMNNNFGNPYMSNPYMSNPYMPTAYGSNQNRMAMLEQQKRDIENQISMLQNQQTPMNQPLTINNNIVPNNQPQQGNFDFSGKFIKNEKEIDEVFNNNLPIILMSSEDSTFYIKNLDGTIKKYRFEEVKENKNKDEKTFNENNEELENIKKQVQQQAISLNQILSVLQANSQQYSINNTVDENNAKTEQKVAKTTNIEKPTTSSSGRKGVKQNG